MNEFLNSKLVQDLRDVINKTDIFIKDPIEKEKFNTKYPSSFDTKYDGYYYNLILLEKIL